MPSEKFYSIGEAAKLAGTTIETLRHYDRIGLLKPAKVQPESNYRYYTDVELIYLEVISFCRKNGMSLREIKTMLHADFSEIIPFLQATEAHMEREIERTRRAKEQIAALRHSLMACAAQEPDAPSVKAFERRAILCAEQFGAATLEHFHGLHENVLQTVPREQRANFRLDNSANFIMEPPWGDRMTMFAICTAFSPCKSLRFLKPGPYLCCTCTEEDRDEKIGKLLRMANCEYQREPEYIVLSVKFTGLFCWQYEIQLPLC